MNNSWHITNIWILFLVLNISAIGQEKISEHELQEYLVSDIVNLNYIEGIWSLDEWKSDVYHKNEFQFSHSLNDVENNTIAVIKRNNEYLVYGKEINGYRNLIKIKIKEKANPKEFYIYEIYEDVEHRTNVVMTDLFNFSYSYYLKNSAMQNSMMFKEMLKITKESGYYNFKSEVSASYSKLYPRLTDYSSSALKSNYLGTGFALSSNGIIVTNYHVVKGLDQVFIRGLFGDYGKTYKAEILGTDQNNDIALLKVDLDLPDIPYSILNYQIDVGSNVWTVGYPLRESMGDEIKLVNGIISSKSGFKGDITSYQSTVPVHPGNSGGPLFNQNGEVVGIITARHSESGNIAYAIKSSYVLNLIEVLSLELSDNPIKPRTLGKGLSEQVKLVTPYVYMIEK
jgi:S1-C subfamily serine protease